jgi:hypothetical protein
MRSRLPIVLALAILVLLQANPAVNWLATRVTARAARAAHPTEAHFVDTYVDSATYLIVLWSALSLIAGVTLVALALLARPDRRWARNLLTIGLAVTMQVALCGTQLTTGSPLWTGPDEWDTIEDSVPVWQMPGLFVASLVLAIGAMYAVILIWRRPARPAPPTPDRAQPPAPPA